MTPRSLLPRLQAFELHELDACPEVIRESLQETLGNALRWSKIYDAATPVFARFCRRVGCESVLDLCSGSGEPVSILIQALERQGLEPPRFAISDRFPHAERMAEVVRRHPGQVEAIDTPVDATAVAPERDRDARTIISAFHHFEPSLARSILADCVRRRRAVFILEPFTRDLTQVTKLTLAYVVAGALNPALAPRRRLLKAALTYALPIVPFALAWDGLVSVLRIYSEQELRAMVEPLGDSFSWEYQTVPAPLAGTVTTFFGVPR